MLTVKLVGDRTTSLVSGSVFNLSIRTYFQSPHTSYILSSTYPYTTYAIGLSSLIAPDYGTDLSEGSTAEIQFGSLLQGEKPWGELRDHDVSHIKASGELSLDRLASSLNVVPGYTNGIARSYYFGDTLSNGVTCGLFGHLFPWGESGRVERDFVQPLGLEPVRGQCQSATPFTVIYVCQTFGDYVYLATAYRPFSLTFPSGWTMKKPNLNNNIQIVDARLVRRYYDPASSGWKYKYRSLIAGSTPGSVRFPNGQEYGFDSSIPFDQSLWTPWISTDWFTFGSYDQVCVETPGELSDRLADLQDRVTYLLKDKFTDVIRDYCPELDPSSLTDDILAQHRVVDTNLLLTVFGLFILKSDNVPWRSAVALVTDLKKGVETGLTTAKEAMHILRTFSKNGTGTYLGTIYGVLPTWSDLGLVWNARRKADEIKSASSSRLHSRATTESICPVGRLLTSLTLTVEHDQFDKFFLPGPMELIQTCHEYGMWPDLVSMWDVVPFSFVVDWFAGIGDLVENLDTRIWYKYYPIHYCIVGKKITWFVDFADLWPDLGLPSCSVEISSYNRQCQREYPLPPIQLGDKTVQFDHWIEATALVAQLLC